MGGRCARGDIALRLAEVPRCREEVLEVGDGSSTGKNKSPILGYLNMYTKSNRRRRCVPTHSLAKVHSQKFIGKGRVTDHHAMTTPSFTGFWTARTTRTVRTNSYNIISAEQAGQAEQDKPNSP